MVIKKTAQIMAVIAWLASSICMIQAEPGVDYDELDEGVQVSEDFFLYRIDDSGAAEITGYLGTAANLQIPAVLEGYAVTSIGEKALNPRNCNRVALESVTVPEGIINIGKGAFSSQMSLVKIVLPNSLEEIGDEAFYWCSCLESLNLPDNVGKIGVDIAVGCDELVIRIMDNDYAIQYCQDNGIVYSRG